MAEKAVGKTRREVAGRAVTEDVRGLLQFPLPCTDGSTGDASREDDWCDGGCSTLRVPSPLRRALGEDKSPDCLAATDDAGRG